MIARPARAPRRVTAAESIDASYSPFKVRSCLRLSQQTIEVVPLHVTASARLLPLCCLQRPSVRAAPNNIAAHESASIGVMILTGERVFSQFQPVDRRELSEGKKRERNQHHRRNRRRAVDCLWVQ